MEPVPFLTAEHGRTLDPSPGAGIWNRFQETACLLPPSTHVVNWVGWGVWSTREYGWSFF